jgi:predicted RNA-binding protein YlqC (UPF0109 family)
VSYLAVNLVEHPDDVRVTLNSKEGRDVLTLSLNPEDQGQFIGKGGQTVRAIRTLLTAINMRWDLKLSLELAE